MYLETMQQVLNSTTKIIVDQKAGQNLLYLPLDRLIGQSGGSVLPPLETGARTPPQPDAALPPPETPARRDSVRTRDREGGR